MGMSFAGQRESLAEFEKISARFRISVALTALAMLARGTGPATRRSGNYVEDKNRSLL
jgi:hypothetical protein